MDIAELSQIFGNFGEFVGALGVVVTLVYLAYQIQLTRQSTQAQMAQATISELNSINLMIASDGSWEEIFRKSVGGLSELSETERNRFAFLELATCRAIETIFYHHQNGVVDAESWYIQDQALSEFAASPAFREWWSSQPFPFTPRFSAYVDERLAAPAVSARESDRSASVAPWRDASG